MNYLDTGFNARMEVLQGEINNHIKPLLDGHGWTWEIESTHKEGDGFLIIKVEKNSVIKRFGIIYGQQVSKSIYSYIQNVADACLIYGMTFDANCSFSRDFTKPLMLINEFLNILKDWNKECDTDVAETYTPKEYKIPSNVHLSAENPSEQCWMLINSLKSTEMCKRYISQRFEELSSEIINSKAEGISFLIQNVSDYYSTAQSQNITQRLLNLYYGTLSFMEADILMNSNKYNDLQSVENITKRGHGLCTFIPEEDYSMENLYTCLLKQGLFAEWLKTHGYDTNNFREKRVEKTNDIGDYCYTFNSILNRLPELAVLMRLIDPNYHTGFLQPYYAHTLNQKSLQFFKSDKGYQSQNKGSYLMFKDESFSSNIDDVKSLIGPLEQFALYEDEDKSFSDTSYKCYSVFIRHDYDDKKETWDKFLNTHYNAYSPYSVLIPLKGLKDDWSVYAVMTLYTYSIIVRYYPNIWRRMQFGEFDKYYAVCLQFAKIIEKVLPHIFYEYISGQNLSISSSMYA